MPGSQTHPSENCCFFFKGKRIKSHVWLSLYKLTAGQTKGRRGRVSLDRWVVADTIHEERMMGWKYHWFITHNGLTHPGSKHQWVLTSRKKRWSHFIGLPMKENNSVHEIVFPQNQKPNLNLAIPLIYRKYTTKILSAKFKLRNFIRQMIHFFFLALSQKKERWEDLQICCCSVTKSCLVLCDTMDCSMPCCLEKL